MMMTEEPTNTQYKAKSSGLGARLKAAREALQLSEKDVAARLHLNPKYITIIENEDFEQGLPATFMRGYLRSYAKLLNLSEYEINLAIDQLAIATPSHAPVSPILHAQPVNRSDRYVRWITYLVMLVLVVLVGMWWNSHARYNVSDVANNSSAPANNNNPVSADAEPTTTNTNNNILPDLQSSNATNNPITIPDKALPSTPSEITIQPPSIASTANQHTEQSPIDLAHMKMEAPEPSLDTSDDGRDDEDGYTN